ncbi:hypothetical protein PYCC9005_004529 [Savitreella phatthalungensis]
MSAVPPTGPGVQGRPVVPPPRPAGGRSTLPILLGLGAALGAGYYLLNPGRAEHDAKVIKRETQNYGDKFDNAVDNAVDKAKAYGKDAKDDIASALSDAKRKAENFGDDVKREASKLGHDAQKAGEDLKAEAKKEKRGWFS